MSDVRENIQEQAKTTWLVSNRKNTVILPTGSGKSKVAIDIVKKLDVLNILLLTNSETLRDTNWKNEFEKFGALGYYENTTSECYQTVYKWAGRTFDLVIADEIDFALTKEYQRFFQNNNCKTILGLTGYVPDDKRLLLETIAPVCYETTVQELQDQDILNKSEFILIEYPLSIEKDIVQKMKNGGQFMTSENDNYKYWDKRFQQATIVKSTIEKKCRVNRLNYELDAGWKAADFQFKMLAAKRKKILHTLNSTVIVANNVIKHIHSRPNNKILIFNTLTTQADLLPNPFHGKSDSDASGIEQLNKGEVNTLSVVRKISRGVNLLGVNFIIRATFDGSETELMQTHGRLMRLPVDMIAKYIILIPIYRDLVKMPSGRMEYNYLQTQAERWKEKMLSPLINPTIRIIRLGYDYTLKSGNLL